MFLQKFPKNLVHSRFKQHGSITLDEGLHVMHHIRKILCKAVKRTSFSEPSSAITGPLGEKNSGHFFEHSL